MNEMKKFLQEPRIKGITGFGNWLWIEKSRGKKDGKSNQVYEENGVKTTPYVQRHWNLYSSYVSKIYSILDEKVEANFREIQKLVKEYEEVSTTKSTNITATVATDEHTQRKHKKEIQKVKYAQKRSSEIVLRVTELKAENDEIEMMVTHHLQRAESILLAHLHAYQSGILSVSKGEDVMSFDVSRQSEGKKSEYDKKKEEIYEKTKTMGV